MPLKGQDFWVVLDGFTLVLGHFWLFLVVIIWFWVFLDLFSWLWLVLGGFTMGDSDTAVVLSKN